MLRTPGRLRALLLAPLAISALTLTVGGHASAAAATGAVTIAPGYPVAGTDIPRAADALVVYTPVRAATPTNQWGVEVTVVGGRVTGVSDRQTTGAGATRVPTGGLVLSGHGAARQFLLARAPLGSTVTITGTGTSKRVSGTGASFALSGTDVTREADALVRYTRTPTQVVSPANVWGAEASVLNGRVVELRDRQSTGGPAMPIPVGGYVLSGHGAARSWLLATAQAGSTVTVPTSTPTSTPTTSTPTTAPTSAPTAAPAPAPTTAPTSAPATAPTTPVTGALPTRVVGGYLTTWEARNGVTIRSIVDNTDYNVLYTAFAVGVSSTSGSLTLDLPPGASSPADLKAQIAYANTKGVKVLLSVGGYFDLTGQRIGYRLDSTAKVDQFMTSMRTYRNEWGFNGMDWDLEQGERPYDKAGIVDASRRMRAEFGPDFAICFAPGVNLSTWVGAGGVLDTLGAGGWDAVGEQVYDQGLSEPEYQSLIVSRMTTLVDKYGASKVLLGNKYRQDSPSMAPDGPGTVDLSTTRAALAQLKSTNHLPRGAFVWTVQSDSDQGFAWQSAAGVGGPVLAG